MNIAVIFAGGSGTRMTNADKPKQFLLVHGKPIIVHTIEIFQKHPEIDGIVVACLVDWIPYVEEMKKRYGLDKIGAIVPGGETGQMSIYSGLKAAAGVYGLYSSGSAAEGSPDGVSVPENDSPGSAAGMRDGFQDSAARLKRELPDGVSVPENRSPGSAAERENDSPADGDGKERNIVLIHDGVRPLIDAKVISDNIAAVKKYGSAITCTPAQETVILVRDEKTKRQTEHVESVPARRLSRFAKAPQSFFLGDILSVEERAISEGRTDMIDSCTLMNEYGYQLHTVIGPKINIKITTPEDFIIFRALYDEFENE